MRHSFDGVFIKHSDVKSPSLLEHLCCLLMAALKSDISARDADLIPLDSRERTNHVPSTNHPPIPTAISNPIIIQHCVLCGHQ